MRRANKGQGSHLIVNVDEENGEAIVEEAEIMTYEILRGKPYSCPSLKLGRIKYCAGWEMLV